jgi:hypothetical protein
MSSMKFKAALLEQALANVNQRCSRAYTYLDFKVVLNEYIKLYNRTEDEHSK